MNAVQGHVRLWKYRVADEHGDAFIRHYSTNGSWAKLFREAGGYVGTQLWQDENDTAVFYTADYWHDRQAFEDFNANYRERYEQLDRELEFLTLEESFLGAGNVPSSGDSNK